MQELHYLSLTEICRRTKSGELSAVLVTETILERIRREDSSLRSYARLMEDSALADAERLDAERAQGKPLGVLHGVPVAVKDLLDTRDIVTASGTTVMASHRPQEDAAVVSRLRQAGAIIVGKTQLTEGAWSAHHPRISAPLNPWNPSFWTGVSSSGSGVATAAGLCFAAIGTDTAGSIRFPAACCGLVGLKPSYGRVSRFGCFPLAGSLDHIGPLTRSVADAAYMLQAIAGFDARDPTSLDLPVPDYAGEPGRDVRGMRIGIDRDYLSAVLDSSVTETIDAVQQVFKELGAELVEVVVPDCTELLDGSGISIGTEAALAHKEFHPTRKDAYGAELSALLEVGHAATAVQYLLLERAREQFRKGFDRCFEKMDLLLAPAMILEVPTLETMASAVADAQIVRDFIRFTVPFNYSGHPSLTLPAGLDAQGLPRSFQLIGPRLGEGKLLQAGYAFEQSAGFRQHPF